MQLSHLARKLQALGLTDKQARVYVAGLFLGAASAQKIAEQADIARPTTYEVIEELAKLGLMSRSVDEKKTVFIAAGNTALEQLLKRQAEEVETRRKGLAELLPELEEIERTETQSRQLTVRFVRGKEGVDAMMAYAMRKARPGSEILSMTNHDKTLRVYPDQLHKNPRIRLNKKLSSKQFYFNSENEVPSDPSLLKTTVRLAIPALGDITLFEDKAVLLSYGSEEEETWDGIIIESPDIVGALRQLFRLAWGQGSSDE